MILPLVTKYALLLVSVLAFFRSVAIFFNQKKKGLSARFFEIKFVNAWLLCFVLSIICFNQWNSFGREILPFSFILPGSLLTQLSIFNVSPSIHRILQPGLWFLFLGLLASSFYSEKKAFFELSIFFLFSFWALEIYELSSITTLVPKAVSMLVFLCFLVSLSLALFKDCFEAKQKSLFQYPIFSLISLCLFLVTAFFISKPADSLFANKIGAHYYSWFPENWTAGYIGRETEPKVEAKLGEYFSEDEKVVAQHLKWAEYAELDFFVFDWWPTRVDIDRRLKKLLSTHSFPENLQFSIQYESLDVKENDAPAYPGEGVNEVYLNEKRAWRLKKHWEHLAKTFMQDPRYLKIDGKAVLFLYASRHFVGPVFEAIESAKKHVLETTGVSLFLVGDEAFYNVLSYSKKNGLLLLPSFIPDWSRLAAFDALTAYNPLDPKCGMKTSSEYLQQFELLYSKYKNISSALGVSFIPTVLPGYNDRGVRPDEKNSIIPRDNNFFVQAIKKTGIPFLDSQVPMLMITSWNEWNEGTQIEPAVLAPAVLSENGSAENKPDVLIADRFSYLGYDMQYLDNIKDFHSNTFSE